MHLSQFKAIKAGPYFNFLKSIERENLAILIRRCKSQGDIIVLHETEKCLQSVCEKGRCDLWDLTDRRFGDIDTDCSILIDGIYKRVNELMENALSRMTPA